MIKLFFLFIFIMQGLYANQKWIPLDSMNNEPSMLMSKPYSYKKRVSKSYKKKNTEIKPIDKALLDSIYLLQNKLRKRTYKR